MPAPGPPRLSWANYGLLVVGIVGVSMSGPIMAGAVAVPALAISMWRTGLGAVAVAPVALHRSRTELRRLTRQDYAQCLVAGLMLACHFAAWASSLRYTSVASATALVCLQVAWIVLLSRLSGQVIARRVVIGLAVALAGVLVVSGVDLTVSSRAITGDALAVLGGVFGAAYVVVGSRIRTRLSTTAYTFVCYASCAGILLVSCAVAGVEIVSYDAKSWGLIVTVTVASQLLGHSVFNHLLAVMSPTVISMVLLLEVPGAALLAAVFLGQAPPVAVYAGLVLVFTGLALVVTAGSASPPTEAILD